MEFEQTFEYGPSGLGDVRFNKTEAGAVTGVKIVASDGTVYPIAPENVDSNVVQESFPGAHFSLSFDESKLLSVRPFSGMFPVRMKEFRRRGEEQLLEPYLKRGGMKSKILPSGKVSKYPVPDQLRFTAILDIFAGPKKGYSYIYWLPYIFERGTKNEAKAKSKSAGALQRLGTFMKLAGYDVDDENLQIPYSDNVLPYLETTLLSTDGRFMAIVENGWPVRLEPIPLGMVFEDTPVQLG